jgi:hypothetical protein
MYESDGFDIELIQDSYLLAREYLVHDSKHGRLLCFDIELVDGVYDIYLDSKWFNYDDIMHDFDIIREFATSIDGYVVDEDTHKLAHWVLENNTIIEHSSHIVYEDSSHSDIIEKHLMMYRNDIVIVIDNLGILKIPSEAEELEDKIVKLFAVYGARVKVYSSITGNVTTTNSMDDNK